MKRITAILLSLCLVLCSCGKGNEPLAKRELIAQTKADASEPPKPIEKTIPIKYLGENLEIIEETSIDVKGVESETTISINYLKDTIPEDTCDIVDAHYWKDGIEKPLTEKPISLDEVDMIELICWGKEVNRSSTPSPTPSATPASSSAPSSATKAIPSASKSPVPTASPKPSDPSKKPEEKKISNKYSYFKIACVVVAVIVATILIVKIVNKCKGKTIDTLGSDSGSEELIPRQQNIDKNEAETHNEEEEEEVNRKRETSAGQSDGEEAKNKKKEEEQQPDQPEDTEAQSKSKKEKGTNEAEDPLSHDITQFEMLQTRAMQTNNLDEIDGAVEISVKIVHEGNFHRITVQQQGMLQNFWLTFLEDFNENKFKIVVQTINALGKLKEVRVLNRVTMECTRRCLDLNQILAEGKKPTKPAGKGRSST
ncbi:MAG: hypothetical protein LBM93_00170 [Oscillospiraceae bacterium]|jgi:hypothetical protein|nr:hypothetical protein [Oscillospiraceae bacterium]